MLLHISLGKVRSLHLGHQARDSAGIPIHSMQDALLLVDGVEDVVVQAYDDVRLQDALRYKVLDL